MTPVRPTERATRRPTTSALRVALLGPVLLALAWTTIGAHPGLHRDIEQATRAIESDPGDADLYARRAHYYRLGEHFDKALADLERGQQLDRDNMAVALGLGLTLSGLGRDAEAEAALNRFIDAGDAAVPAYAERAAVRARSGRLPEAIADYTSALAIQRDVELYLLRGELQEALGDHDAAAMGYTEGLESLGGAAVLRLSLIRAEAARGNFDAALDQIDGELERATVKTDWYLRKSDVLRQAGRVAEAESTLGQALAEANRVLTIRTTGLHLFSRAKVYAALGRTDEARKDLEDTLMKSPRFADAQELLARIDGPGTTQED